MIITLFFFSLIIIMIIIILNKVGDSNLKSQVECVNISTMKFVIRKSQYTKFRSTINKQI